MYNVPRTTARNKLEGKSPTELIGHGGVSPILGDDINNSLANWVLTCTKMGFNIDREGPHLKNSPVKKDVLPCQKY